MIYFDLELDAPFTKSHLSRLVMSPYPYPDICSHQIKCTVTSGMTVEASQMPVLPSVTGCLAECSGIGCMSRPGDRERVQPQTMKFL